MEKQQPPPYAPHGQPPPPGPTLYPNINPAQQQTTQTGKKTTKIESFFLPKMSFRD